MLGVILLEVIQLNVMGPGAYTKGLFYDKLNWDKI
jgi:hypothetical protein